MLNSEKEFNVRFLIYVFIMKIADHKRSFICDLALHYKLSDQALQKTFCNIHSAICLSHLWKKINIFFSRNFFVKFVIIPFVSYSFKQTLEFHYLPVFLCIPWKFDLLLGKALIESVFVSLTLSMG